MEEENNETQDTDVEVLEFALTEEEIDDLILKLDELKDSKTQVQFEVDEENELVIHYENEQEEGE